MPFSRSKPLRDSSLPTKFWALHSFSKSTVYSFACKTLCKANNMLQTALSLCIFTFGLLVLLFSLWTHISQHLFRVYLKCHLLPEAFSSLQGSMRVFDLFKSLKHFICPSLLTFGSAFQCGSLIMPFLSFPTRF